MVDFTIVPASRHHLLGDTATSRVEAAACIILGFCIFPLVELSKAVKTAWATVQVCIEF